MKRLIDTSVLIDHLRGHTKAKAFLVRSVLAGDELWSVTVVRTEVLAGMRKGEERATYTLLDALQWLDVTPEVADLAGELAQRYLRSHPGVDTIDYLIAAAAQHLNAELATLNLKHFPMLPTLRPPY